jgi:FkbM family methyltransferase
MFSSFRQTARNTLLGVTHSLNRLADLLYLPPAEKQRQAILRAQKDPAYQKLIQQALTNFPLKQQSLILDLGAYHGDWTHTMVELYHCQAHVFEPNPTAFRQLGKRLSNIKTVHGHAYGLAHKTIEAKLYLQGRESSLYPATKHRENLEFTPIHLHEAKAFFERYRIAWVDLMKLDIEGGEYDLLNHLIETGWIKKIKNVLVQFHYHVPNATERIHALQKALSQTHTLTFQEEYVWENWRLKAE